MSEKDDKFAFWLAPLPSGEHMRALTASEAEEWLRKRLEESGGKDVTILNELFKLHLHTHETDKAMACVNRLMDLTENAGERSSLLMRLGMVGEQMRDYSLAEAFYRDSLRLGLPNSELEYWACNNLGYSLNQLGRHAEAEPYLKRAIALVSTKSNAFKNLGLSYQGLGRFADAVEQFIAATHVNAADERSLAHLEALVAEHPELHNIVPALETSIRNCRAAVAHARSMTPDFEEWWRKLRAQQDREQGDED